MNLYGEILLDHFKNPQNFGELPDANASAEDANPLCGDKIKVYAKIGKEHTIENLKYTGEGCAVSMGAMSILSQKIIGRSTAQILKMDQESILELIGIEISPGRIKCAILGLACIKKMINKYESEKPHKDDK